MDSQISNDDKVDTIDTTKEKTCIAKELPLPLPFPADDSDDVERDNIHSKCDDAIRQREDILKQIVNKDDRCNDEDDRCDNTSKPSVDAARHLSRLPSDVFVLICCSLTVQDITSVAKCSKSLYVASLNQDLWRAKFRARWNYDDPTIVDWSSAYRQAYFNPHDLWITHWNCVEPSDGLGPGRCCVRNIDHRLTENLVDAKRAHAKESSRRHRCPTCRYHPCLQANNSSCDVGIEKGESCTRVPITTAAQAIQTATSLRLEECSHLLPCKPYSPKIAEHAFKKASTFHRFIDHRQYKDNALFFLDDLLFFHVHDDQNDNSIDDEPFEMRDWKKYVEKKQSNDEGTGQVENPSSDSEASEPALHSWHLANVCNPDYDRPIVWRILIQRSDCFTVFPSEGYLLPGESKVVTFSVKPFGSMLAHASNQVNVHRDGVDEFWRNLHATEARLPCTPFLFQYHYASNAPSNSVDNACLSAFQQQQQVHPSARPNEQFRASQNQQTRSADAPWRQCLTGRNQYVRSIYLEGHVHANYSLSQFRRKTLVPFILPSHQISRTEKFIRRYLPREQHYSYSLSPVVFCSPQLMEFFPLEWQRLQALRLEEHRNKSALASKYRTEMACHECGLTWGPRMEELGQAFVLAKLEMESTFQNDRKRMETLHRILECLVQQHQRNNRLSNLSGTKSLIRNQQIIRHLRRKVMNYRGAPWLSHTESRVLLQWEVLLDLLFSRTMLNVVGMDPKNENPVAPGGVYRYPTCTDSIFNKDASFDRSVSGLPLHSDLIYWKKEPKHLKAFSHLVYGPGKFHFPHTEYKQDTLRKTGRLDVVMTDIFMNDTICGLKAALSVLADPRSLLIHGLFDEVPFPGSISRRPKLPILSKFSVRRCFEKIRKQYHNCFDPFITSQEQLAYYELQESLDIHMLLIMNSFVTQTPAQSISLRNFIQNIPPPGRGRFAIKTSECHVDRSKNFWFLEKSHATLTERTFQGKLHGLDLSTIPISSRQSVSPGDTFDVQQVPGANNHVLPRGPRILNILWLVSSQFGWRTGNNYEKDSVYIDRRILIATQCFSLSMAFLPIAMTLFGRYFGLIPTIPTSYHLEGIPYEIENKMRYLTEEECGYAGVFLISVHSILHRWIERHTDRQFLRTMVEHIRERREIHLLRKFKHDVLEWAERIWDATCPLALQRILFIPRWNRRKHSELLDHVSYWRSQERKDRQATIRAVALIDRISEGNKSLHSQGSGITKKILAFAGMTLFGFSASSPHFFLNFLAVFSCGMSAGISMSIQSLETGQSNFTISSIKSAIESVSMVTAVIFGLLVGQLTGSSGGVLFLVEFVVTFVSLFFGGMGTISASGIKSWGTFFCLWLVAFWGYHFGRCSIIDNINKKRSGIFSVMLCGSLLLVFYFSLMSLAGWHWETVQDIVIQRP